MSASSQVPTRPAPAWVRADLADGRDADRLPWPVAAPLIGMMALACWVAVWKGGAALLSLLP